MFVMFCITLEKAEKSNEMKHHILNWEYFHCLIMQICIYIQIKLFMVGFVY